MRNLFLIAVLTTTMCFTSFAQSSSGYGIKAGLNYNGNGDYFDSVNTNFQNPDRNIGFHIGIFGKIGKDLLSGDLTFTGENNVAMGAGFIAAFVAGLAACTWMIQLVKKSKLSYFAIYCLVVGLIAIGYGFWAN